MVSKNVANPQKIASSQLCFTHLKVRFCDKLSMGLKLSDRET